MPIKKIYDVVLIMLENKDISNSKVEQDALVTDEVCYFKIPPVSESKWYY